MTGTLVKRKLAVEAMDEWVKELVKRTILKPKDREATDLELALFAEQAQRTGMDPFGKQIYGIFRYDKRAGREVMQIQVAIDGFRLIAERTGKYQGQTDPEWCDADGMWHDVWLSDEPPTAARVGVYKAGHREPTRAVAHWREYVQTNRDGNPTDMWRSMPANQISKCAEALALRKCFPNDLSGLYTPEEMAQADSVAPEVVDAQPPVGDRPSDEQILALVESAMAAVEMGALTDDRLKMMLVSAGASDTETAQAAAQTMTAQAVDQLHSDIVDLLSEAEEQAGEGQS